MPWRCTGRWRISVQARYLLIDQQIRPLRTYWRLAIPLFGVYVLPACYSDELEYPLALCLSYYVVVCVLEIQLTAVFL